MQHIAPLEFPPCATQASQHKGETQEALRGAKACTVAMLACIMHASHGRVVATGTAQYQFALKPSCTFAPQMLQQNYLTALHCLQLLEQRDTELEHSEASIEGLQKGAEAREAVCPTVSCLCLSSPSARAVMRKQAVT